MKTFLRTLSAFVVAAVPGAASAAATLWVNCTGLAGCGSGWTERFTGVLTLLLSRLPVYGYGLAVLFIMIGGANMILSAGDSEKVTRGKSTITWAVIGIFVIQSSVTLVSFIQQEVLTRTANTDLITSVIRTLQFSIFDLLQIALLGVAIFSGMRMVLSGGQEEQFKKGQEGLLWAAIGAIVINLANSLVTAFQTL